MGYKDFAVGEVLTSQDVDNFLMRQTVMVFDDSASRATAIGTAIAEGMTSYLKDIDSLEYYDGSSWLNVNDNTDAIPKAVLAAQGDLIYGASAGSATALSIGTAGQFLTTNGTVPSWTDISTADEIITTQGDLIIGDASGNPVRLPIGTADYVLTSDGTAISWEAGGGAAGFYYSAGGAGGTASVSIGTGVYVVTFSGGNQVLVGSTSYSTGATMTEFTSAVSSIVFDYAFGVTWTTASVDIAGGGIVYDNGIWVGTGLGSTTVIRSTDGVTWTSATLATTVDSAAAAGNGTYVVAGNNVIYSSTDGTTWTTRTSPATKTWRGGKYANGYFVLGASDGTTIAYSTDGLTWTSSTLTSASSGFGIDFDGTNWWAARNAGGVTFYSSTDLVTWTSSSITVSSFSLYGCVYWPSGTNKYFAFPSSSVNPIYYSTDGVTWASTTAPSGIEGWAGVAVGPTLYATDNNDGRVLKTTDGVNWTTATDLGTGQTRGIALGEQGIIASHTGNVHSRSFSGGQYLAIEEKSPVTAV